MRAKESFLFNQNYGIGFIQKILVRYVLFKFGALLMIYRGLFQYKSQTKWHSKFLGFTSQPISTSSPKASPESSLNVTDATSVTSKGSRKVDVSKISRLLDHLTYDDDGLCEYDDMEYANTDDICFYPVIEDVLDKGRQN